MYMHFLFLFLGSSSAEKQGDFGIFTPCLTKNNSLRLKCGYAVCENSPNYTCVIRSSSGLLLSKKTAQQCTFFLQDHALLFANKTSDFNCTLIRRGRIEEKNLSINYSLKKIKICADGTNSLLQQTALVPGLSLLLITGYLGT